MTRRMPPLVVAFALLHLVIGGALPVAAAEPLPECRYDDVRTRYTGLTEWRKTLLDTILKVPRSYAPGNLVSTSEAGLNGGYLVRRAVIDDLRAMAAAARADGAAFKVASAYRSYARQKAVFRYWVKTLGYEQALRESARPGHSEHQLGTTLDFRSAGSTKGPWDYEDWGATRPGRWLDEKAWRYGFVMSYTEGHEHETCYIHEPWHYRYLGRRIAADVRAKQVTLRRFLWERFETTP